MARGIRRTDTSDGRWNREVRALWAAIRELRAAKRVITEFTVPDADGDVTQGGIVHIGTQEHGDRGLEFRREDGTVAFSLSKELSPSSPQSWRLNDRNGNIVVEESTLGAGLNRPYLEMPFQPVATTPGTAVTCGPYGLERSTASGTFETLFAYDGKAQNLLLDFKFAAVCSDGTTAGEVQVVDLDSGTPRPGFVMSPWLGVVPAGTTTHLILNPASAEVLSRVSGIGPGGYQRLGVQVRRTSGAGSITLSVIQSIGG